MERQTEFEGRLAPLLTCLVQRLQPRPRISGRGQRRCAGTFFRGARCLERLVTFADGEDRKDRIADVAEDFATMGQYRARSAVEKIAQERKEAFNLHLL